MKFNDRVTVGDVKETKEGYLVATARVARTGVQEYLASELGDIAADQGFAPTDVVRVFRHPDQVFADGALNSITRVPVTLDHPPESVTAENWAQYSVGEVGDAYSKDAEWVIVNPMIKDASAIRAARDTHKEISMGYEAEIVKARDGIDADFEQTNIHMNHLALVPQGRAGAKARIGDGWGASPVAQDHKPGGMPKTEKGGPMADSLKTVVLGDAAVQVSVSDVAAIEQFKTNSAKALSDAKAEHKTAIDAKDAELAKLQAKLDDAEGKVLSAEDVDKLVADRSDLLTAAKSIAPEVKTEGLKDAEIRKAVVVAKLGDAAVADKSEAYIDARFDILVESASKENPVRDALNSNAHSHVYNDTEFGDAHNDYVARLTRRNRKESK